MVCFQMGTTYALQSPVWTNGESRAVRTVKGLEQRPEGARSLCRLSCPRRASIIQPGAISGHRFTAGQSKPRSTTKATAGPDCQLGMVARCELAVAFTGTCEVDGRYGAQRGAAQRRHSPGTYYLWRISLGDLPILSRLRHRRRVGGFDQAAANHQESGVTWR